MFFSDKLRKIQALCTIALGHILASACSSLTGFMQQALYATALGSGSQSGTALPELYTEGLDAEQIWLQLDMQLGGALKRARRLLRKTGDTEQLIHPAMEAVLDGESVRTALCWHHCPISDMDLSGPLQVCGAAHPLCY